MFLKKLKKSTSLKEALLDISEDEIVDMVYKDIFSRGKRYYKNGYVLSVEQSGKNSVIAKVEGSYDNSYNVKFSIDNSTLIAKCDCHYNSVCKHIVAILLDINYKQSISKSFSFEKNDEIIKYLTELSKEELIALVVEFAPKSFKKELILKSAKSETLEVEISAIKENIKNLLNDKDLLYNPIEFQKQIMEYVDQLAIVVNQNIDEIFEFIFDLADSIDAISDDGYLYIEYPIEEYFHFDVLSDKICEMISKLDSIDKQIDIFLQFVDRVKNSGRMMITYNNLEIKDKSILKEYLYQIKDIKFYYFLEDILSFEEKERYLREFKNPIWMIWDSVVDLYMEYNKKELAIEYLETLLNTEMDMQYIKKLLELTNVSNEKLKEFILFAIENNAFGNFDFIVKNMEKFEEKEEFEQKLKEKDISIFYKYLDKENRVEELFKLLDKLPDKKEEFFKKYKKIYQSEAIAFFQEKFNDSLKTTTQYSYLIVIESLKNLKELLPKDEFNEIITNLKIKYPGRKKFLSLLDENF